MSILSYLRLRTKLAMLAGLAALGLITSIGLSAFVMHQGMVNDKTDKLRAIVEMSAGLAQSLENQVTTHKLTHQQALEQFRDATHAMRFDHGEGYFFAQPPENEIVVHGASPTPEYGMAEEKDASGKSLMDLIAGVLRNANQGVVSYSVARPGASQVQSKVIYVERFTPWNLVFVAGAHTEDLDAAFHATLWRLIEISGIALLLTLIIAWVVSRDIAASVGTLTVTMARISRGEFDVPIPGTARRDEVGTMAGALVVLRDGMRRAERLSREQADECQQAEVTRRAALVSMAETIATEADGALKQIGTRTDAMVATADEMQASAARTRTSAETAAAAAGQALANAQTVASVAEELFASIRDIGGQVSESAAVISRAVEAASGTRRTIETLNTQVGRIGAVADMIGEIAAKTNLLALNATIEAARAGEAGKGFAVVASEVKVLATQTARSTDEIGRHIAEVRVATDASVASVGRIEQAITEVNRVAGAIVAAVEQQSAATAEIARSVTETASAANEMTNRASEVSSEAVVTGRCATDVRDNAGGLMTALGELRHALVAR